MGDYANDVRKGEHAGHVQYQRKIDGIIRQNCRREASVSGEANIFRASPEDGVILVNIDDANAQVNLPTITRCRPDQEIRICAVDPDNNGNTLTVYTASSVNDTAGPNTIAFTVPAGHTSASRKFQRCQTADTDSWYIVCCLQETELQ